MSIQTIGACLATLGTLIAALLLAVKVQERTVKRLSKWDTDQPVRHPSSARPERRTWIDDREFSHSSRVLITSMKTKE
jgi:hypothetical protein